VLHLVVHMCAVNQANDGALRGDQANDDHGSETGEPR
jgi:hypothetical protein